MPLTRPAPSLAPRPVRRRGVTIVEMLVTLTLVLVMSAALGGLFINQLRGYGRTREAAAIQHDLRTGLGFLPVSLIGEAMLWAAAALTLVTGWDYLTAGLRHAAEHDATSEPPPPAKRDPEPLRP